MKYLHVPLEDAVLTSLRELARRELRPVRLQASVLIVAGLKALGLDPDAPPAADRPEATTRDDTAREVHR